MRVELSLRAVAIALLLFACVIPPLLATEDLINHAPTIDEQASRPAKAAIELNTNCTQCTFSVQVGDVDRNDVLYYRWFIDYDIGGGFTNFISQCEGQIPATVDGASRAPVVCNFPLDQSFSAADADGVAHAVEMWVSDRQFLRDPNQTPVNKAVDLANQAKVVTRQWMVTARRRGTVCDDVEQMSCVARQVE